MKPKSDTRFSLRPHRYMLVLVLTYLTAPVFAASCYEEGSMRPADYLDIRFRPADPADGWTVVRRTHTKLDKDGAVVGGEGNDRDEVLIDSEQYLWKRYKFPEIVDDHRDVFEIEMHQGEATKVTCLIAFKHQHTLSKVKFLGIACEDDGETCIESCDRNYRKLSTNTKFVVRLKLKDMEAGD